MALAVNINAINVNVLSNNSGNFLGENQQFGWNAHTKQNTTIYMQGITNTSPNSWNLVTDNDMTDAIMNSPELNSGLTTQQL